MRISDWSSDVCSSDLRPHAECDRACVSPSGALIKRAHDLTVEATDTARTAVGHERHVARLPRLETHGRAGGNVEPKQIGRRSWRERGCKDCMDPVVGGSFKKKKREKE